MTNKKSKPKHKQGKDRTPIYKKQEAKAARKAAKIAQRSPREQLIRKRLRQIGRVFLWSTGIFVLLTGILVALAAYYEDDIAAAVLEEVNKNLVAPIEVSHIDITLFRSFPNASVDFRGVKVPDANGETLLRAEKMAFRFNAMSLLGTDYKIKSIVIDDGYLNIQRERNGNFNYDIAKANAQSDTSGSTSGNVHFEIDLKKATLQNMVLRYNDKMLQQSADLDLEYLDLSGNFSAQQTTLTTSSELTCRYIKIKDDKYLPNTTIAWNFDIDADLENQTYTLNDAQLNLQANTFRANGRVQQTENHTNINLGLKGENCTILSVIAMLPERQKSLIRDFNSRGRFYFNIDVNGRLGKNQTPAINAEFGLKDGQITSPRLGESLQKVNFAATFNSNQNQDSAVFNMAGFVAELDNRQIDIDLRVEDIDNPLIDFRLNGDVNLGLVYRLSNNPYVRDGRGLIKFQDLIFTGRLQDMTTPSRLNRVDASGIITTKDFEIEYKKEPFKIQDGYLTFDNELLTVRRLQLFGANSDFLLNLNLQNVLPVVLADSTNRGKVKVIFDGELSANNIDFDKLLEIGLAVDEKAPPTPTTEKAPNSNDTTARGTTSEPEVDYTSIVKGRFRAKVDRFNFRKVKGNNFAGTVEYDNKEVIFKNVGVEVMDGKVSITSNLRLYGKPRLEAYVEFIDIDSKRFFIESENFGQDILTDKNIDGRLDSKILVNAYWDKNFNFQQDQLYVLMDLTVRDGALKDFKMMEDFSQFVKIEDLKEIRFTDMRNQFRIQNSILTIPTIFIQSNALNLTLAGQYGFNNDVNFKFKINAGQVVASKFRKFNPNRTPKKAKRNGWFNIYVGMEGNLYGDLQFDYTDKKDAKKVLEDQLKLEFQDIQSLISDRLKSTQIIEPDDWNDDENNDDGSLYEF